MASKDHALLKVGGAAAAAFAAYEFLYKPWRNAQLAAQAAAGSTAFGSPFVQTGAGGNFGLPFIQFPTQVGPMPSNLDPGAQVGGPIGYCMHYKGWTQSQCQTRYNKVVAAYKDGVAKLAALQNGSQLASLNAALAADQAALTNAQAAYNAAVASGDAGRALVLQQEIGVHLQNMAVTRQQIAAIPTQTAAFQTDLAQLQADFLKTFGQNLTGAL